MEGANPYQAPETDQEVNELENGDFSHLNFKQLKKLFNRSQNVTAITGLIVIGAISLLVLGIISLGETGEFATAMALIFISLLYILTAVGLTKRNSWGRKLGIGICTLSLINIPLGTLIGLAGLFAFFKAPELFGENRITHKSLKEEYTYRKKNKLTK